MTIPRCPEIAKFRAGALPVLHIATDMDLKMREVFQEQPVYDRLRVGQPFPQVCASP